MNNDLQILQRVLWHLLVSLTGSSEGQSKRCSDPKKNKHHNATRKRLEYREARRIKFNSNVESKHE